MIKDIFDLQNPWRTEKNYRSQKKTRKIFDIILQNLENPKIIGLTGSRQTGKSSLMFLLIEHLIGRDNVSPQDIYYFNLDDLMLHSLFKDISEWISFVGKPEKERKFIIIDEIQRLPNPGLFLKELFDLNLNYKIIFSGSSQLEIKSKVREHLAGRVRMLQVNRLSFSEYIDFNHPVTRQEALEEILVFGSYPEVSLTRNKLEKKLLIKDIYQTYIEKDLADFLKIENIDIFNKLIRLLAAQTGSLLNLQKLSNRLRISRHIIEKYIEILENTFIIKRLYPFYKNYKKEITRTPKIYFLDLGLRNFALNNFEAVGIREDTGYLFENFHFLELLNSDPYSLHRINFWRTSNGTEIDFVITGGDSPLAVETKWSSDVRPKSFTFFAERYPEFSTELITAANYTQG